MKKSLLIYFLFISQIIFSQPAVKKQVVLEGNNIRSFVWNTGVFNQDLRTNNTPGFEWMKSSGKFALFTTGLTLGSYINDSLAMAIASYNGEYSPGYSQNGVYYYDDRFRHYSVKKGDNHINNPDWLNWGLLVSFGAPYIDVNSNGSYEYFVDTPGVRGASQTIFICMSDGYAPKHTPSEGFGGGTQVLHAEVHLTAWCYDNQQMENVQFFRWEIINKHTERWDSVYFALTCDSDLGDATDDYMGSDTLNQMVYSYNADNMDGDGSGVTYGANPPAVGIMLLKGPADNNQQGNPVLKASSLRVWHKNVSLCERDPSNSLQSYRMLKGLKLDGTPFVIPNTTPPQTTKFTYTGDPETGTGWTEYYGRIENCGGSLNGEFVSPCLPGDRRMIISSGGNLKVMPGERQVIYAAQFIARGSNNKNSVTLLKNMALNVKQFFESNITIGIEPVSLIIPDKYSLQQNYPNPFNPVTKIKFDIPKQGFTSVKIYDALGRLISTIVNENLKGGEYSVEWNASNYPSGIYFYSLQTQSFTETKKMVLVK